jgi:histidinol phosphatase-like enzyme
MKSLLEKLNCTEDALELGKNATKDEVQMLQSLRDECGNMVKSLVKVGDNESLNEAMKIGMKAQYCREALEVAKSE